MSDFVTLNQRRGTRCCFSYGGLSPRDTRAQNSSTVPLSLPLLPTAPSRCSASPSPRRKQPLLVPYLRFERIPEHTSVVQRVLSDHDSIQENKQIGSLAGYRRSCKKPYVARTASSCRGKPKRPRVFMSAARMSEVRQLPDILYRHQTCPRHADQTR